MESKNMTPSEFFNYIKDKKQKCNEDKLKAYYELALGEVEKVMKTGQTALLTKLKFHIENYEKEYKLLQLGIDEYVTYDDISQFIEHVGSNVVKIVELKNYTRTIPDDIVETISKTSNIFSEFYVIFTDYTGKEERKVKQKDRDKDPILFGCFCDRNAKTKVDRYYFLGDWEDEFCDLTFEKMLNKLAETGRTDVVKRISDPNTQMELISELNKLRKTNSGFETVSVDEVFIDTSKPKKIKPILKTLTNKVKKLWTEK